MSVPVGVSMIKGEGMSGREGWYVQEDEYVWGVGITCYTYPLEGTGDQGYPLKGTWEQKYPIRDVGPGIPPSEELLH